MHRFDCCDSVDQHGSQRHGRSWHDTVTCRLCRTSGGTDAKCGLDGVVCSAQEAVRFKQVFGQEFKLVTPGIRPQGSEAGDQRRIMTPEQALSAGVDYMVIGRPVTQSVDPAQTLKAINASLQRSA